MKDPLVQIAAFSTAINAGLARIAEIDADILRATEATLEADKIHGELEALSNKRAELKARAFVEKTVADTTALDKEEKSLERAGRQAVEDGQAARMAIGMLEGSRAETQAEIESLSGQRKVVVVEWLTNRRDLAIKRYVAALGDLGAPLAEALAVDKLLAEIDARDNQTGSWLLNQVRAGGLVIPHSYKVVRPGREGAEPIYDEPFSWMRDQTLGDSERDLLASELCKAGMELGGAQQSLAGAC